MSWWDKLGRSSSTEALRKIAHTLSRENKIKINLEHGGGAPATTDVAKKEITIDLDTVYRHGEDYAVGLLLHEVAHIRYSPTRKEVGVIDEELEETHSEVVAGVYNWLEDRRIDALMREGYLGAATFQDALDKPSLEGLKDVLEGEFEGSLATESGLDPAAWRNALGLATLVARGYDTTFCRTGTYGHIDASMRAEVAGLYKTIGAKSTGREVALAAKAVLNALRDILPPPQQRQGRGGPEGAGAGGESRTCTHTLEHGGIKAGREVGKVYTDRRWRKADQRATPLVDKLKRKLVAKLRDTEHERFEGGQRRGRLDRRRLIRAAYQENPRVYRRRVEVGGKRYSFAVLLDTSGSMFNWGISNIETAMEAAAVLIRAIRGLGFRASLTLFSYYPQTILYSKDRYSVDTIEHRYNNVGSGIYNGGGTDIYSAVAYTIKQLARQPHNKVLVILTDGGITKKSAKKTKEIVEAAARRGIKTIIYYIEDKTVRVLEDDSREVYISDPSTELIPETEKLLRSLRL